jgi:hypothetical protein
MSLDTDSQPHILIFTPNKICKKLHALSTPAIFQDENPFSIVIAFKSKTWETV